MAAQTARIEPNHSNKGEQTAFDTFQIQAILLEILQSGPFKSSKQSQQLLQYIVQQTAKGHHDLLKERIIGAQVFGRRADYDTNDDPIVRTRAGDVRKRLAQYYLGEGRDSAVRIEISPGSYHATFVESPSLSAVNTLPSERQSRTASNHVVSDRPAVNPEKIEPFKTRRLSKCIWITTVVAAIAVAAGAFVLLPKTEPIEVFWQPLLDAKKPVLIYSGANAVYMLSGDFMDRYKSTHRVSSLEQKGQEFVVPLSSDIRISAADLVPYKNEFVTLGDLSANVRVAALLTLHKKSFDMRSGEDVAFSDLHESPSLLIGAFNNKWTLELTGDLPFTFDRGLTIRDTSDGTRSWTPSITPEGNETMDYAIVTRIPHSKSDQPLITIAGITQSGTRAAADFITSPQLLNDLLKDAPKDWKSKSMQVILQTKVENNIPTSPVVVATKYW